MNYAIKHPDHVSALILLNSAPANYKGQKAYAEEFAKRTLPIKNEINPLFNEKEFEKLSSSNIDTIYRTLFSVYFYKPKQVSELTINMNEESVKSGLQVMKVMTETSWMKPDIDLIPQLEKLNVPTLVVHGKQDINPLRSAQKIMEAIPHAQMVVLEHCGHFSYIEKPDQLFARIHLFLSDVFPQVKSAAGV